MTERPFRSGDGRTASIPSTLDVDRTGCNAEMAIAAIVAAIAEGRMRDQRIATGLMLTCVESTDSG
ncbi:hypothetical protein [Burkholderia sp. ABCPW 11]|uniref:hypothetical protein n=1 Tax=Burkholderia sp. ABCPW 11 TaxID=1637859 RepID=UPI000AC71E47|nr:hypothetical protein [Burkholderia sp. ABCPW 11]